MALNKALWTLFTVIFVDMFQLLFVFPLLPALVAGFGGSDSEIASKVALLAAFGAAAEAIGCSIIGSLSDKYGRRPVMMLATLGGAASAAAFGFSRNFYEAAAARILNGVCGGTMGVAQAYVTDVTTEAERPEAQNKITASFSLGLMAGPAVGGFLYSWGGIEVACLCAGGISFLNLLLIIAFLQETAPSQRGAREVALLPGAQEAATQETARTSRLPCKIWILFLAWTAFAPIMVVFDAFANMYLKDKYFEGDEKHATQFFSSCATAAGAVVFLVSMWLYGPISRALGFNGTLLSGGALAAAGLIGMGTLPRSLGPVPFLISVIMMCFGMQLVMPSIPVLIGRLSPPESVGRAFGLNQSFGNWARVFGPFVFTPLYNAWHPSVWLIAAGLFIVTTAIVLAVSLTDAAEQRAESSQCSAGTLLRHVSIPGEQAFLTKPAEFTRSTSLPSERSQDPQQERIEQTQPEFCRSRSEPPV